MQCQGHQFLAGAGLAGDQHGENRTRQPADGAEYLLHGRRRTDNARRRGINAGGGRGGGLRRAQGPADQRNEFVYIERFGQIFVRAALKSGHGAIQIRVRGHHNHRQVRRTTLDLLQQLDAVNAGHAHVGDNEIRRAAG